MKKSIAILLLVSLMAPFTGTFLFVQYKKNRIKKEIAGLMTTGMDEKDLIRLTFARGEDESALNWRHAGEFEFEGRMYDVVETIRSGDSTVYICYRDHKEQRLKSQQSRMVSKAMGQDPGQKSQTENLVNFFKTVFQQKVFDWKPITLQTSIFNFSFIILNYSSLALSPPAPPPKLG